jgi:hypothetical protein
LEYLLANKEEETPVDVEAEKHGQYDLGKRVGIPGLAE